MNLRAAVAPVVPLLLALFAFTGCEATTHERVATPTVIMADRTFRQTRAMGLMPRAESAAGPTRSLSLIVSDHERKIGR